jgi:outer membrane protein assembly factor BamB
MSSRTCSILLVLAAVGSTFVYPVSAAEDVAAVKIRLQKIGVARGICMLMGGNAKFAIPLAQQTELTLFVHTPDAKLADDIRKQADAAGLLGTRVYVHHASYERLPLAENLVDVILLDDKSAGQGGVPLLELQRVLHPGGKYLAGPIEATKPMPADTDAWTHPYHGPDNNPQSNDLAARRPFLTHFLAEPWYCPLTQMSVAAGGRIFKAFGDRSSAKPQEDMLNKLIAMNAYNGTILWQRDLTPGFLIHRNTLIATPDVVFLGDDKSCKILDAANGKVRDEIVVPADIADGPTWKWMALEDKGTLFGLVGEREAPEVTLRGDRIRGAGWPWWKYGNYKYGYGRTLLAVDPSSKKILWHHREQEPIDGRAVCLRNGKIYFYSEQKFLACLDSKTGKLLWKNSDADLLEAIGVAGAAQHPMLGFASTAYMKVGDDAIYFAGPQRPRIVGASLTDGTLLWKQEGGNVQLVLRKEGLYALGEGRINSKPSSMKLDPVSGKILATFASRDRCTRATGCADSIFTRGGAGGSTAVFDLTSTEPKMNTITPMRPACTDGVVVAHGHLFWGPWMCACDQTQIGVISLASAGAFDYSQKATDKERFQLLSIGVHAVTPLPVTAEDWPTYRKDNKCSAVTPHEIPAAVVKKWQYQPPHKIIPTAPTAAGGLIFVSGADGIVRALDSATGKPRWSAYTGGPVKYPPTIWKDFAYTGSGDGWIYCLEAATGKTLWRFRAAPVERMMPVYGSLSSTWPVGSGVLVEDGVAYAAAGIFNYDGTHVYALDAETGKIKWQNNTSGSLPADDKGEGAGVSVQGHLVAHGGAIYMPAGNKPTIASYAMADGKFAERGQGRGKHLFIRKDQVRATGMPLYWRPDDSHFLTPMELECPAGVLVLSPSQKDRDPPASTITLQEAFQKSVWSATPFQEIAAVAIGKNAVLVTGVNRDKQGVVTAKGICAIGLSDGKSLWQEELPAPPVAWGLALDRGGQVIVSMTEGKVMAFGTK